MMTRILAVLFGVALLAGPLSAQTITPQGRLTLTSATPVMTTDVTAATSAFYACYTGNVVQVAGTNLTIPACNLAIGFDTTNHASGSVYDFFGVNNAGTLAVCTGPAWTSTTGRGIGAGTTEIELDANGLWTNAESLTNCYGGAAGTTNYGAVSANAGTYLGSVYMTSAGTTKMEFSPAAAAGGTNNRLALYNAYNRVSVRAFSQDNTASWTYNSSTWRSANNSASNRITYLDGLGQSQVSASYVNGCDTTGNSCDVGVNFSSTTATPGGLRGYTFSATATHNEIAGGAGRIGLGLAYAQAMEARSVGSGTITFWASGNRMILSIAIAN